MGLFVRFERNAPPSEAIDARKQGVERLFAGPLQSLGGPEWYEQGYSKAEALSRRADLTSGAPKPWTQSRIGTARKHRLALWNGSEDERGMTAVVSLWQPPAEGTDTIVVTMASPELAIAGGIQWTAVLDLARALTRQPGGLAIVSAGELAAFAESHGLDAPDAAVYAAFWSADAATRDSELAAAGEVIVASSWDEVRHPDLKRVRAGIEIVERIRAR